MCIRDSFERDASFDLRPRHFALAVFLAVPFDDFRPVDKIALFGEQVHNTFSRRLSRLQIPKDARDVADRFP